MYLVPLKDNLGALRRELSTFDDKVSSIGWPTKMIGRQILSAKMIGWHFCPAKLPSNRMSNFPPCNSCEYNLRRH